MMAFSTTKLTFAEDLGTEIVDIFVGPDRKRYVVHKKLLTAQSDYFDKALNGRFREAEENSIHLKEEDPGAVDLLIGWLYRGAMPGTQTKPSLFFTSGSPSSIGEHIPVSEGSRYLIAPLVMNEPNTPNDRITFQHLCGQAAYAHFSPEEIRLADYKANRLYPILNTAPINGFGAAPQNTAIPTRMSLFSSLGGTQGGPSTAVPTNPFAGAFPNMTVPIFPTAPPPPAFVQSLNRAFDMSMTLSPSPTSDQNTPSFGSTRTIKHPKSAGVFLSGIPRAEPIDDQMIQEDYQQRCLVHLCILAETICWPALFNAAIEAYVQGERNLHRPIPLEHVDLIYERTHYESTLRLYVIDSISRLDGKQDHLTYMPLAQKYDEFLEDLLRKVSSSAPLSGFAFDKYRMPSALQTGTASVVPNGVFGKKDEVGTAEEA